MLTFDKIFGNTFAKRYLTQTIVKNKKPHCLVFSGDSGLGKSLFANTYAKSILCEKNGVNPCGVCYFCKTFDSKNNPDAFYPKPTKTKNLGVQDVRDQIVAEMETLPYSAKYKIFIIENADLFSVAAQNALLKTIEEPKPYGIFLLTCENYFKLIETVRSRAVHIPLNPVALHETALFCRENLSCTEDRANFIAALGGGNLGLCKKLLEDDEYTDLREKIVSLLAELLTNVNCDIFASCKELEAEKLKFPQILDFLITFFRELIVFKETRNLDFVFQTDLKEDIVKITNKLSLSSIIEKFYAVFRAKEKLFQNGNFALIVFVLVLELRENLTW